MIDGIEARHGGGLRLGKAKTVSAKSGKVRACGHLLAKDHDDYCFLETFVLVVIGSEGQDGVLLHQQCGVAAVLHLHGQR